MQIWRSPYMFVLIQKQHHVNSAFLILTILELFATEACKLLKNRLIATHKGGRDCWVRA